MLEIPGIEACSLLAFGQDKLSSVVLSHAWPFCDSKGPTVAGILARQNEMLGSQDNSLWCRLSFGILEQASLAISSRHTAWHAQISTHTLCSKR